MSHVVDKVRQVRSKNIFVKPNFIKHYGRQLNLWFYCSNLRPT